MTYHGDEAFPALSDEQWARETAVQADDIAAPESSQPDTAQCSPAGPGGICASRDPAGD